MIVMQKYLILVVLFMFTGCKCPLVRVVELGHNFALTQVDDTYILYDYNGNKECYYSSENAIVVPAEIVAYNSDNRWIIAKAHSTSLGTDSYYIVDKKYDFTKSGYAEELKRQTTGPLDSIQFYQHLIKHNIKLELKDSRE